MATILEQPVVCMEKMILCNIWGKGLTRIGAWTDSIRGIEDKLMLYRNTPTKGDKYR